MESAESAGSVVKYMKENLKMANPMAMVEKSTIISITKACSKEELNVDQEDACGTLVEKMEVSEFAYQKNNFYIPTSICQEYQAINIIIDQIPF